MPPRACSVVRRWGAAALVGLLLGACGGGGGGGPTATPVSSPIGFLAERTTALPGGHARRRVATGFFDGDAFPDVALGHEHGSGVTVLLGLGDGTFEALAPIVIGLPGPFRTFVRAGAFDLDPFVDLVVVDEVESTVQVYLGGGDGTFDPVFAVPLDVDTVQTRDLEVGRLDDDVLDDVVIVTESAVHVLLAAGGGGLVAANGSPHLAGAEAISAHVGHLTGSPAADLVVCATSTGLVHVLAGSGDGEFTAAPMSPILVPEGPALAVTCSIDGTLGRDLVVQTMAPGVRLYLGDSVTLTPTAQGHGGLLGIGPMAMVVVPRPRAPFPQHDDVVLLTLTLGSDLALHLTRLRPIDDSSGNVLRTSQTTPDRLAFALGVLDADQDGEPDLLLPLFQPAGFLEVRLGD